MSNRVLKSIGFGTMSLVFAGVLLLANQGRTDDKKPRHMEHNATVKACAKSCSECQLSCDVCASFCGHMLQDGKKQHLATLTTCQNCATICSAASQIVARSGPFSKNICEACAEACTNCAMECEKFPEDEQMKACAEACMKCAHACRDMLKQN